MTHGSDIGDRHYRARMPELRLASYNTHWGRDRRGRTFDVTEVCRRLDADIVVMQESWRPRHGEGPADRAASALGYSAHHLPLAEGYVDRRPRLAQRRTGGAGTWGISILSRLDVEGTATIELGDLPMDQAPRRACLEVEVRAGPQTFAVFGVHLAHLSHGSPLLVRRLRRHLPPAGLPAAVAGDMNMWGPFITALLPGWRRAVRGPTWPARWPHSQIDHILVTPAVEVLQGTVVKAGRSDHRPVTALLRF